MIPGRATAVVPALMLSALAAPLAARQRPPALAPASRGGTATEIHIFSATGAYLGTRAVPGRIRTCTGRLPWLLAVTERQGGEADGELGIDLFRVR